MIRTAFPFGDHIIFLCLLAVFVFGLIKMERGIRTRRIRDKRVGGAMSLGVVLFFGYSMLFEYRLEENPRIVSNSSVIGKWEGVGKTVHLKEDFTFERRSMDWITSGTWKRNDFNLYLQPSGGWGPTRMRFIAFDGELRLQTKTWGDADTWDGDLGIRRVHPGPSKYRTIED
jgi:hypothetical protein